MHADSHVQIKWVRKKTDGNTSTDPMSYLPTGAAPKNRDEHRNSARINGQELSDRAYRPPTRTIARPQIPGYCHCDSNLRINLDKFDKKLEYIVISNNKKSNYSTLSAKQWRRQNFKLGYCCFYVKKIESIDTSQSGLV
jgi:hypothetical protein